MPTLAPTDREALRRQITAATAYYRSCHEAADRANSEGSPRLDMLIRVAAAALRKRDALLEQWPRQEETP